MEHEVPEMQMIIIKRGQPQEDHPHGGAWKVAFADFMTAMMAFFLVLWIVNSTNKETRSSVARYFNPIRISDTTAARKGLKDPREVDFDASASSTDDKVHVKAVSPANDGQTGSGSGNGGQGTGDSAGGLTPSGPVDPVTARDPFIVLDELAGRATGASAAEGRAASADIDLQFDGPAPFRDPFAPPAPVLPPEARPAVRVATAVPSGPSAATTSSRSVKPATSEAKVDARAIADAKVVAERLREEQQAGERAPARDGAESKDAREGKAAAAQQAMAEAADLRRAILRVLAETGLAQGPKLEVSVVDEGILISLTDDLNFGMFAIGSAEPQPRVVRAMEKIGELLSTQPGGFVVRGHTDSRAYKSRAYDNWRLSSARAQMAAYMLMRGKLDERRIERVEGHADRALRNTADPLAAENRRIEILLRRVK